MKNGNWRELLEQHPDGVLLQDKHGEILYANPAAKFLLEGENPEELLPDYSRMQKERECIIHVEGDCTDDPGLLKIRSREIDWENRSVMMLSLTAIEEFPVQEQQKFLTAALESTADGILIGRCDGTVAYANQRFFDMWELPGEVRDAALLETFHPYISHQVKDPEKFFRRLDDLYHSHEECMDMVEFHDGRVFQRFSAPLRSEETLCGRIWSFRDITTQIVNQGRIEESERQFRTFVEQANDIIYTLSPEGVFTYVSPNWRSMLGHEPSEVVGQSFENFVHPEDIPMCRKFMELVYRTGEKQSGVEYRVKHADGTWHWHTSNAAPMKAHDTASISYLGIARDITDRKHTEEALEYELQVNSELANLATALISSQSIEEISEMVLQSTRNLTGSEYGFVGYIDPETGNLVAPTMTRTIWEQCGVEDKDTVFEKFGGLWGWVLENKTDLLSNNPMGDSRSGGLPAGHVSIERFLSVPATIEGTLVGQIALANPDREYTTGDLETVERFASLYAIAIQQRRITDHLKLANVIVENSPVVLFRWANAPGWPVDYVSGNIEQFGYRKAQFLSGEITYEEIIHPEDRDRVQQEIRENANDDVNEFHQKYRIRTSEGTCRWVEDYTEVIQDGNRIAYFQGLIRDITDQHTLEELREKQAKRYQEIIQSLEEPLSIVDEHENFTYVNEQAATLYGYPRDELIGMNLLDLLPEADVEKVLEQTENRKAGKSGEYNLMVRTKQHELTELRVIVTPLFDDGGEYHGAFAILQQHSGEHNIDMDSTSISFIEDNPFRWLRNTRMHRNKKFVRMCSHCQNIHDNDRWIKVDKYFTVRLGRTVSHGICPKCIKELYGSYFENIDEIIDE